MLGGKASGSKLLFSCHCSFLQSKFILERFYCNIFLFEIKLQKTQKTLQFEQKCAKIEQEEPKYIKI
jgi:hypothetical protein